MLTPANLAIYQGDDWAAAVNVLNADGTPADLTGYTAQAQIRSGPADQSWAVAAEISCVVEDVLGLISLSLTHDQTSLLTDQPYVWDMQITSPDNEITTLLNGQVAVALEVTRELPPAVVVVMAVRDPYRGLFI